MVHIRPAWPSDAPGIIALETRAFQTPMARWFEWTKPINFYESMKESFHLLLDPNGHHYVACDDQGRIVGFCTYAIRGSKTNIPRSWLSELENKLFGWQVYLSHIVTYMRDRALLPERERKGEIFETSKKNNWERLKESDGLHEVVYVGILVVDTECQGKGVGGRLLQLSMDEGARKRLPVHLEATERGYPFYLSKGFEEISTPLLIQDGNTLIESFQNVILKPPTAS